jgi:hypothetical protein
MMKKEKLVLTDLRDINFSGSAFKVKKLTNTIDYRIGDYLSTGEVEDLLDINPKVRNITIEIISK